MTVTSGSTCRSRFGLACPHCGARMRIRTSRKVSALSRDGIADCTNMECGWRTNFTTQYVSTLVPSATPAPDVFLPLAARVALPAVATP